MPLDPSLIEDFGYAYIELPSDATLRDVLVRLVEGNHAWDAVFVLITPPANYVYATAETLKSYINTLLQSAGANILDLPSAHAPVFTPVIRVIALDASHSVTDYRAELERIRNGVSVVVVGNTIRTDEPQRIHAILRNTDLGGVRSAIDALSLFRIFTSKPSILKADNATINRTLGGAATLPTCLNPECKHQGYFVVDPKTFKLRCAKCGMLVS